MGYENIPKEDNTKHDTKNKEKEERSCNSLEGINAELSVEKNNRNKIKELGQTNQVAPDSSEKSTYFEHQKDSDAIKDEIGTISVKNMAKFWEEVSKKIMEEASKAEPKIQKKWNSMPDLKDRFEKRKLPLGPTDNPHKKHEMKEENIFLEQPHISDKNIVKSDEIIDDVDLCRSVSIRDRKQMFEMMAKQARKEKKKQWSSMPSLKQDIHQSRATSPSERGKVHWEDDIRSGEEDTVEASRPPRGKPPVKEIMKNFEVIKSRQHLSVTKHNEISNRYSHSRLKSPVSPLLHTNEVFSYKDDFHSSSESISSSLTSASTVVPRSPGILSMLEDSGGEIYTDSTGNSHDEHGLFVVENGTEFALTPVNKRKSIFEVHKKSGRIKRKSRESFKSPKITEQSMLKTVPLG